MLEHPEETGRRILPRDRITRLQVHQSASTVQARAVRGVCASPIFRDGKLDFDRSREFALLREERLVARKKSYIFSRNESANERAESVDKKDY